MQNTLISVVIPAYKVEKYLEKCIDSITNQSYGNLEIIIVEDGSPDGTAKLCDVLAAKDSRIRVIHKENGGVSQARNTGIAEAKGKYICFVDGDDWVEHDMCEKAIEAMEKHDADVVMWSYLREYADRSAPKLIYSEDRVFEGEAVQKKLKQRIIGLSGKELAHPENADCLSPVWGKLYKTELLKDLRFIDLKTIGTNEDGLFNIDVFARTKKVVFINEYLYHYRKDNAVSITSKFDPQRISQWNAMFGAIADKIRLNKWGAECERALDNRICLSMIGQSLNICRADDGLFAKIGMIKRILKMDLYRKAYKNLELKYFPVHWKAFFFCCKKRMSFGVFALAQCILRLKKSVG